MKRTDNIVEKGETSGRGTFSLSSIFLFLRPFFLVADLDPVVKWKKSKLSNFWIYLQ